MGFFIPYKLQKIKYNKKVSVQTEFKYVFIGLNLCHVMIKKTSLKEN